MRRVHLFHDQVFVGPGQEKEAQLIGLGLRKLHTYEKDDLDRAKRYAMDQSVKYVMLKQREAHQQQVIFFESWVWLYRYVK